MARRSTQGWAYMASARYPGRCRVCGKKIAQGAPCWYDASGDRGRKVICLACQTKGAAPTPPTNPHESPRTPTATANGTTQGEHAPTDTHVAAQGTDGVWRHHWSSVEAMVEDAARRGYAVGPNAAEIDQKVFRDTRDDWHDGMTIDRALAEVKNPPAQDTADVLALKDGLQAERVAPVGRRRKLRRNREEGEELDPVAWAQRRTNGWSRLDRLPKERRIVRIGINLSVHSGRTQAELFPRGAAVLALADLLADQGYDVEIIGFDAGTDRTSLSARHVTSICMKAPDQPLDLAAVGWLACSIGAFRRCMLRASARMLPGVLAESYGSPTDLPPADAARMDAVADQDITTEDAARDWLTQYATQIGGAE